MRFSRAGNGARRRDESRRLVFAGSDGPDPAFAASASSKTATTVVTGRPQGHTGVRSSTFRATG
jgi:hypothetical protein